MYIYHEEMAGTADNDILGFPFPGFRYPLRYWINRRDGEDRLFGDGSHDIVTSGAGAGVVVGDTGHDGLLAELGGDLLKGGEGDDVLDGGDGDDLIRGGKGNDKIDGGAGNDKIFGGIGRDKLVGGTGRDTLDGGRGRDFINGGKGNDTIVLSQGADKIIGGRGHDTLDASDLSGAVVINATSDFQGFPVIAPGTITLADATVQTLRGIESFAGSDFDDTFYGEAANSLLRGRAGDDRLETSGTGSRVLGGKGNDRLRGDGENIRLEGGNGDDFIDAFGVRMTVLGGNGDDTISITRGGGDKDSPVSVIRAGPGNDVIKWLDSDVRLEFDARLKVFGGNGADVFDFGFYHSGTIQDFQNGVDQIDLSVHLSQETPTAAQLMGMITDTARGAVLTLDFSSANGFEFLFVGVQAGDFVDSDFIF